MTTPRLHSALLWCAAFALMVSAAVWQRLTGPTYPLRGHSVVAGEEVGWRLLRSAVSDAPFHVSVPAPAGVTGTVHWRRYPLDEPFAAVPMARDDGGLAALLPHQPPAGKLEYYVVLESAAGPLRIPEGDPVVMRFKGFVPAGVLIPHVVAMFLSMMIGVRSALAAALGRPEAGRLAWFALAGITVGGLVLGPIVQKYAFGAYWTGWPFGADLTDNKTLAMWLAWLAAVVAARWRPAPADRLARAAVVAAALVMLAVYVVPHSLRGSQLDYGKLQQGGDAHDAITTGR